MGQMAFVITPLTIKKVKDLFRKHELNWVTKRILDVRRKGGVTQFGTESISLTVHDEIKKVLGTGTKVFDEDFQNEFGYKGIDRESRKLSSAIKRRKVRRML